jgi:4-oxalocrotonate tautomerase
MPLVRIDLREGKPADYRVAIGEVIYDALLSIGVPPNDRFQITLNEGRSLELKKRLYQSIADQLHSRLSIRREDVFINLVEVKKENWSFGNGEAQYT